MEGACSARSISVLSRSPRRQGVAGFKVISRQRVLLQSMEGEHAFSIPWPYAHPHCSCQYLPSNPQQCLAFTCMLCFPEEGLWLPEPNSREGSGIDPDAGRKRSVVCHCWSVRRRGLPRAAQGSEAAAGRSAAPLAAAPPDGRPAAPPRPRGAWLNMDWK